MKKALTLSHDKPDHVLHPVETDANGWLLGRVVPDVKGYYPSGGHVALGAFDEAYTHCQDEAARRGISNEAYDATVFSSMGKQTFEKALALQLNPKTESRP